jgi:iron complex outermembrane recepter protein
MGYSGLRVRGGLLTILIVLATGLLSTAFAQKAQISLPEQSLSQSLKDLARQSGSNILFTPDSVKGIRAPELHGQLTVADALAKLLAATDLEAVPDGNGGLIVRRKANQGVAGPQTVGSEGLSEIVVTGTHIHASASDNGSSVTTYSRSDIEQSGAATLDQFARKMPENFASVDASTNGYANAPLQTGQNGFNGAGFNLHGLGPGATLTLLDGHRMSSGGGDGEFVDISLIPVAAIDKIEVLPDGSSAIYGGDAVAGVVNIILRKDFEGAETTLRGGGATNGGDGEYIASQLFGQSWGSGNAIIAYEYDKQNGLRADQRDFVPDQGGLVYLLPQQTRNSVFLTAKQDILQDTQLSGDAYYSKRDFYQDDFSAGSLNLSVGKVESFGGTLALNQKFAGDWSGVASGTLSKTNQDFTETSPSPDLPTGLFTQSPNIDSTVADFDFHADGSLFSLPSGPLKAALGAEFRLDRFDSTFSLTDGGQSIPLPASDQTYLQRHIASAYAELLAPIIGASGSSAVNRLELSVAGRYDHYSDFGGTTNPKIGLSWLVTPGLTFRASYGTSFVAPALVDLVPVPSFLQISLPDNASPTGSTVTLINNSGGNASLKAQRSTSYSLGLDFNSLLLPHFNGSISYFNIDFKDRIATPPVESFFDLLNEPAVAPFVTRNPSLAQVESIYNSGAQIVDDTGLGAAGVQALYDGRYANIAKSQEAGFQFMLNYRLKFEHGVFGANANVSYLLKNAYAASSTSPAFELLNTLYEPTKVRGRGGVSWTNRGFTAALSLNYVGSYANPLTSPETTVAAWATEDLSLSYSLQGDGAPKLLRDLIMTLAVQNLTNRDPPRVIIPADDPFNIGYDAANASPLGRQISLSLSKRW